MNPTSAMHELTPTCTPDDIEQTSPHAPPHPSEPDTEQALELNAEQGAEQPTAPVPAQNTTQPPASTTASAVVDRTRAHARLRAAWMERLWNRNQTSADQGLAITSGEVDRILSDPSLAAEDYAHFLTQPEPSALLRTAEDADAALAADPFWQHLAQTFDLTASELDLLALLAAVELDPHFPRVLAYLADDTRATAPTLLASTALFAAEAAAAPDALLREVQGPPATPNILRWRLAHPLPGEPAWRAHTPWQADEALIRSICEQRWTDPATTRWSTFTPAATNDPVILSERSESKDLHLTSAPPQTRVPNLRDSLTVAKVGSLISQTPVLSPDLLTRLLTHLHTSAPPIELSLTGPEGSGRQTLATQLASSLNRPLLVVNTPTLLAGPTASDDLIRAVRTARATNALLYWRDPTQIPAADWREIRTLAGITLTGTRSAPPTATESVALPPLSTARRLELWSHLTDIPAPAILRTQRLTPAEIVLAANSPDEASLRAALTRAVPHPGDLLNILPCPYTWDDLVLAPEIARTLHDLEAQVRLRWEVYEEWGFSRLTPIGQGISALFGGPSGTGKTMAAQVLARSLGLTLYRVDLAGVVNKYIGETEKHLRDVFDICERSSSLLFFDEADALFGARMKAEDAHDRFANIEIDYLLQRIEQFDGVSILGTNRKNDLDVAFLRRLRFVIDFLPPGKPERLTLWQKALPPLSPSGEEILDEIDYTGLANHLELNGAQIKSIALGAAFLARSEGTKISMQHLERAASRELAKQGLRLRQPFAKEPTI
jgi:AAA+ superfamily predicted ATPase